MDDLENIRAVYDDVAPAFARLLPDLRAEQPLDRALLTAFAQEVLEVGPGRVLDAGCGTGRLLEPLRQLGLSPRGVDLSPGMIAQARRCDPETELAAADLGDLPYGDSAFDGVIAWYSLIHHDALSLRDAVEELARVTVDGGAILAAFHVGRGSVEVPRAYGTERTMPKHLRRPEEIADLLDRCGWTTTATIRREPVQEEHPQGFVMARRGR